MLAQLAKFQVHSSVALASHMEKFVQFIVAYPIFLSKLALPNQN